MKQEEKNKLVEEVLNEFDFAKVDRVMRMLDWEWSIFGKHRAIPGIYGLMTEARDLLYQVLGRENEGWICCGGFRASWDGESLELEFILTSYEASTNYHELTENCDEEEGT